MGQPLTRSQFRPRERRSSACAYFFLRAAWPRGLESLSGKERAARGQGGGDAPGFAPFGKRWEYGDILTSLGNGRAPLSDLLVQLCPGGILPSLPWPGSHRTNSKRPKGDT